MTSLNKQSTVTVQKDFNPFIHVKYEHLIAGISGGITSTLILQPLDVIKIRLAVNDGRLDKTPKYTGITNAFVTIAKQEGLKGLYKGVTPNVWGAGTSWGLYFFFYNALKTWIRNSDTNTPLGPAKHLMAASQAGAMTLLITNPIWVVKTRLCLQYDQSHKIYNGMIDALRKIYQTEGIRGYYKGFIPGLFGVSHGAIQFMVYEEFKYRRNYYKQYPMDNRLNTIEYLTFAAVSKIIAAILTYPYQVMRARLQNQFLAYDGLWHCMNETWCYEGWKGFYKGLGTNLLRVTPATMITFVTYENVSYLLTKK